MLTCNARIKNVYVAVGTPLFELFLTIEIADTGTSGATLIDIGGHDDFEELFIFLQKNVGGLNTYEFIGKYVRLLYEEDKTNNQVTIRGIASLMDITKQYLFPGGSPSQEEIPPPVERKPGRPKKSL